MDEQGPYEILPYSEVHDLKKDIDELRKNQTNPEIVNSIGRLTGLVENMLTLFQGAAKSMQKEGEGALGQKLDKVLEQQETLAESILVLIEMVKEIKAQEPGEFEKPGGASLPDIQPEPAFPQAPPAFSKPPKQGTVPPMPNLGMPSQKMPPPMGQQQGRGNQNNLSMPPSGMQNKQPMQGFNQKPMQPPPMGQQQGGHILDPPPMPPGGKGITPMPTGSFKDLEKATKKKGLFGKR